MAGYRVKSQKLTLSPEAIRDLGACILLPFLMQWDIGYGIHIAGAAYYTALLRRRTLRPAAMALAAAGIFFLGEWGLRWKYGTLMILLTAWEYLGETRLAQLAFWKRGLLYESLFIVTVLLLSLTRVEGAGNLWLLLMEGALFFALSFLYQNHSAGAGKGRDLLRGVMVGTVLAAVAIVQVGPIVPAEILLLCLGLKITYEKGPEAGIMLCIPAAACMRLSGMGSDGLLILYLVLMITTHFFCAYGVPCCLVGAGSVGMLYLLFFMRNELAPGLLTLGGALLFWSLWVKAEGIVSYTETDGTDEWKRYLRHRLERSAGAFAGLADLMPASEMRRHLSGKDTAYLMENVAGRVCTECPGRADCWSTRFALTRETIEQIMEASGEKGRIEEGDLPEAFREVCGRAHDFVKMVNRHFELYRLNLSWENRMGKGQELIRRQYEAMAGYLENICHHLTCELSEEEILRQKIERYLQGLRFPAESPWVMADGQEDSILVSFRYRGEMRAEDCARVCDFLSDAVGRPMRYLRQYPEKGGWRRRLYRDEDRIRLKVAAWRGGEEKISGDSYILGPLDEYRYIMALSDGMGSGSKAREESRRALRMLEQYLLAGISEETAVALLNTTMVMGAREESFATVDLAVINLHRGRLRLVKAGAVTTYLCSRGGVRVCRCESLPVGLLEDPAVPEMFECELQPEDCIVMVSDGVLDQVEDAKEADRWIRHFLIREKKNSPEEMIEGIQKGLASQGADRIGDDKTILAAIVKSRSAEN